VSADRRPFSNIDRQALAARGVSEGEAARQLELLGRPPTWTRLDRPCTLGDGVRRLVESEYDALLAAHRDAAEAGRFIKFVPASGAATRMFRELLYYQRGPGRDEPPQPDSDSAVVLDRFVSDLERFAFFSELEQTLARRGEDARAVARDGEFRPLLDALLDSDGMDYDDLPKGRLLFHHGDDGARTAFEEHLVEAARYARRKDGSCRLHFTVSTEHRKGFEALLETVGPGWAKKLDASWDLGWSHQQPSTDTLAIDAEGNPVRDEAGHLVFRPGGHGALIENIGDLDADLIYIKNIDNVQPEHAREATVLWKKLIGGLLAQTESQAQRLVRNLNENGAAATALDEAGTFAREALAVDVPEGDARAFLTRLLNRPLRVAGVVPNTGEPGGGPFWVRGADGDVRAQIVETAQVDPGDSSQQTILGAATHFNPVDLVCAVRDFNGNPFDLSAYIDEDSAIVTSKSIAGRDLRALERPGLWNGAMAGWNTIFVEVPLETFTPVKSVLDLLRPEHQPPD
jgi:hypothetical protein